MALNRVASEVSLFKAAKPLARDFGRQAAISDVLKRNWLITAAARPEGNALPLLNIREARYGGAQELGHSDDDMAAVNNWLERYTAVLA